MHMNSLSFKKRFVVYRRVAELLLPSVFSSAVITLLNITGIVAKRTSLLVMISVFVLVFTVLNLRNLRNCYYDICNKKLFFILNFSAYAIFAAINFAVLAFAKSEVYAWVFSITKGLRFLYVDIIYSVLLFHFIQLMCIIGATIGMEWIFDEKEEDEL